MFLRNRYRIDNDSKEFAEQVKRVDVLQVAYALRLETLLSGELETLAMLPASLGISISNCRNIHTQQ